MRIVSRCIELSMSVRCTPCNKYRYLKCRSRSRSDDSITKLRCEPLNSRMPRVKIIVPSCVLYN
jgi:hypothetical protein